MITNPKTGGFGELFLPKNDFKTCSAVNFPEKQGITQKIKTADVFWKLGN